VQKVRIPAALVGLTEAQARAQLNDLGLDPRVVGRFSASVQPGIVISTNPPPGREVEKGSTVTVFVSRGQQLIAVENVVGKSFDEAKTILESQGFVVNDPQTVESDTVPKGDVIAQSPNAGEQRAAKTPITLQVSSGPAPVTVPSVIGRSEDAARAALADRRLVVGTVTEEPSNTRPAGTVIASDPAGGEQVAVGSKVNLTVSSGPEKVAVPDETNRDVADASADLSDKGFTPKVVETPTDDPDLDGKVKSQDPPGGSPQPLGTTVTLTVYKLSSPPPESTAGSTTGTTT
jgi:serine/threonine-protein kinase